MDGANQLFRSNPRAFLQQNQLVCYTQLSQQKTDINRINGNTLNVTQQFQPVVEFDLQRHPMGYYNVALVGGTGSFATSSLTRRLGYGSPIVGNYIPYLGQKDKKPKSKHFGRINLSQVQTNFVFTFTFTGCNFVVTQNRHDGDVYVYHEPTADSWTTSIQDRYPDDVVVGTVGPRYDDNHVNGYGCLIRIGPTRWRACVQTSAIGQVGVTALDELEFSV